MESQTEALITLLKKAGRAHHKYEIRQLEGVTNQAWPVWYADFLIDNGVAELLTSSPNTNQLSKQLKDLDTDYSALPAEDQEAIDWPSYYAPRLISYFAPGDNA